MTDDEILKLAKNAGLEYFHSPKGTKEMHGYDFNVVEFAKALLDRERLACENILWSTRQHLLDGNFMGNVPTEAMGILEECADKIHQRSYK